MSNLDKFSEEERELLISLPYRIGCMISDADDEEGGHDDEQEQEALENTLNELAGPEKGTPFTREVVAGTLAQKNKWPVWQNKIFDVHDDAEKARAIIIQKLGKTKAKNFRVAMLKIAASVAKAADEFDDFNPEDEETGVSALIGKIVKKVKPDAGREQSHLANISPAEKVEIDRLSSVLKVED